jgi:hypothetical protein
MVETISNEILCTMTGNITWSTSVPMRSVYIAGIKYTTASSGAMLCPPTTRFCGQFFSGLVVAPPDPDLWTPAAPGHVDVAFCAVFASRSGARIF